MPLPSTRTSLSIGTRRPASRDAGGGSSRIAYHLLDCFRAGGPVSSLAMRVAVWGVVLGLAASARADIYLYRDPSGTLVFTNAPVERATRLVLPEVPPARRMLVPYSRDALL